MNNPRILELRQQIQTLEGELAELMRAEGYRDDCPCGGEWCPIDDDPRWLEDRAMDLDAETDGGET